VRLRSTGLSWQELDGCVVVLDLESSVYLEVNASGAPLFHLLADGAEEGDLVEALRTRYSIDETVARRDVTAFLTLLRDRGLLDE
jgi:hypothetical protein